MRSVILPALAAVLLVACGGAEATPMGTISGRVFVTVGCGNPPPPGATCGGGGPDAPDTNTSLSIYPGDKCEPFTDKTEIWQQPAGDVVTSLKTDSQGSFSLALPAGTYIVWSDEIIGQCFTVKANEQTTIKLMTQPPP
jgi:hypothetical protein